MDENTERIKREVMATHVTGSDASLQLMNEETEILNKMGEIFDCTKNAVVAIQEAVSVLNVKLKKVVRILGEMKENIENLRNDVAKQKVRSRTDLELKNEEMKVLQKTEVKPECSRDDIIITQEAMANDYLDPAKAELLDFLTLPETFEDVAVTFSDEEWKMLRKQDKELHKEVMVQNYKTMVSVGYEIPPEKLLLLFKVDDELLKEDTRENRSTEQKDNHEDNLTRRPDGCKAPVAGPFA
ncbi:zinc finger protein 560-like [Protopterus annectens]|uniref:zinc finger protein 560-like n=1 Tax=Protopterus annectens TaxID=7888 RepID=UPI001CF9A1DA|nr:zinc finger protein 560-like [Protopterus annectens]XP_043913829.1 zinc finger protein 560-like [Protopterus annectens]